LHQPTDASEQTNRCWWEVLICSFVFSSISLHHIRVSKQHLLTLLGGSPETICLVYDSLAAAAGVCWQEIHLSSRL
jgi:hypothetical protein